jgi:chemotaxis protein CheD
MQVTSAEERQKIVTITQGEFAVSEDPTVVISTLLGSCVAICLHDPVAKVGGANHILLPGESSANPQSLAEGSYSMEVLINALLKKGALKNRLIAKVLGGGQMVAGLSDVGNRNGEFALQFLADERIEVLSTSLGGTAARRIQFWPYTGRLRQKLTSRPVQEPVTPAPKTRTDIGAVELF